MGGAVRDAQASMVSGMRWRVVRCSDGRHMAGAKEPGCMYRLARVLNDGRPGYVRVERRSPNVGSEQRETAAQAPSR